MLLEKVSGADGIIQEKYITITAFKKNVRRSKKFLFKGNCGIIISFF